MLLDTAEEQFGPVDILINNATGSLADTFAAAAIDRLGRSLQPVTAETWTRQFTVDAMGAALMISEFARRHIARQATWGRIIGLTSGGDIGFPEEVSYGAAKAAQENYHDVSGHRARPVRDHGQHGPPARHRHRLGHQRRP